MFQGMELSSSNIKSFLYFLKRRLFLYFGKWNFFIFQETELFYILGNGNPKNIPYIPGNGNRKKLLFQEVTFLSRKMKKTHY